MMFREVLAGLVLVGAQGWACANGNPVPGDGTSRTSVDSPFDASAMQATVPDEPPSAQAVAAYLTDVLTPGSRARRTPTGYAMLDTGSRITHTVEVALTSHQCWKIKDGYQCRSTVRTTTTPANGRVHTTRVEVSNDYQWRAGRLFSARLEAMRQQTQAQQVSDDAAQQAQQQARQFGSASANTTNNATTAVA